LDQMYKKISKKSPTKEIYKEKSIREDPDFKKMLKILLKI
jgi:hypothetical protein